VPPSRAKIYEALFELAQCLSGHDEPDSLCDELARSLRRVVHFDFLALALHDPAENALRLRGLSTSLPMDVGPPHTMIKAGDEPASWVWNNQQPVIMPRAADDRRWPAFSSMLVQRGIHSISLFPLTNGSRRIGVLGLGSRAESESSEEDAAFLARVASEVAVTLDAHLSHQALRRERDRLSVLFEITNTLVAKLSWDDLLPAISAVLGKVLSHEGAAITVLDKANGLLQLHALHVPDNIWLDVDRTPVRPEGLPKWEALASGEAVIATQAELDRFPSRLRAQLVARGVQSICSLPMVTANGLLGTLELARATTRPFTVDEVAFASQVARQIATALENSLAFQELAEIKEKLATEKLYLEDEIRLDHNLGNAVGESPAFQALLKSAQIVAPTDASVLIMGETGTGKELVARAIHEASTRSGRNFVKVNCAAIPATLLESELFGHEKGAFTGAVSQKMGRFELADQGTLFLDEIGEIPLELQPKLLRAIQEQEFERLGGNRTIRIDVRIIAATNRDLKTMMEEGRFRSDLYYRLLVFPIRVPPLRERREDIPLLVRYFTQKFAQRMSRPIEAIPSHVMEALTRYHWPGNIRELQNLIERSVILTRGTALRVSLPDGAGLAPQPARGAGTGSSNEREIILRALEQTGGVVGGPQGAAARLGLKRTTLQSRMKRFGIGREYR
jgi:formate hydrogenlyase transcriptional activator